MSKKFLTLIYGDRIHAAPHSKVLPAEEFSKLVTANEALQKIEEDVKQYKLDVAIESEKLKEQAQIDGFNAGFSQWTEHVARLEAQIESVRAEMSRMVIPVALKAAKKIVGREIELKDDTIIDIVINNLKAVSQHRKITIYLNRKDLTTVEKQRPRIKAVFENLETLSIRERSDIAIGGCMIETEGGIINAQIDQLWIALENAFTTLMKAQEKKAAAAAPKLPEEDKEDEEEVLR